MAVYALSVGAGVLFYTFAPASFWEESFYPSYDSSYGLFFWIRMGLLGTAFTFVNLCLLWLFLRLLGSRLDFRSLVSFMAFVHVFYGVMFLPMALGAALGENRIYRISEMAFSLWGAGVAVVGLKELTSVSIPKVFFVLVLSTLATVGLLFGLYWQGVLTADSLKALIFL